MMYTRQAEMIIAAGSIAKNALLNNMEKSNSEPNWGPNDASSRRFALVTPLAALRTNSAVKAYCVFPHSFHSDSFKVDMAL